MLQYLDVPKADMTNIPMRYVKFFGPTPTLPQLEAMIEAEATFARMLGQDALAQYWEGRFEFTTPAGNRYRFSSPNILNVVRVVGDKVMEDMGVFPIHTGRYWTCVAAALGTYLILMHDERRGYDKACHRTLAHPEDYVHVQGLGR